MKWLLSFLFASFILCASAQDFNRDSLQQAFKAHPKDTFGLKALSLLGRSYINSNPDTALQLSNELLELAKRMGSVPFELRAMMQIAYVFSNTGNPDRSLQILLEGLKRAEDLGQKDFIYLLTLNIGLYYQDNGDPVMALSYVKKAMALSVNSGNELASDYQLLAGIYFQLNELDSTRYYISRYNQTMLGNGSHLIAEAETQVLQGDVERTAGNLGLAMEHYRLAVPIYEKYFFNSGIAFLYGTMSEIFRQTGRPDSALYYSRAAFTMARNSGNPGLVGEASKVLYEHYKSARNTDSALLYLQELSSARDSVNAQDKVKQVRELGFNERLRQQEIAARKTQEAEERKSNLQLAAIAIFIPFFFLFVLLLSRRKIKKKTVEYLGIVSLLLAFEFVNLFLHPYIVKLTHDDNILMLLILVVLAAIMVPMHHNMEHRVKHVLLRKPKKDDNPTPEEKTALADGTAVLLDPDVPGSQLIFDQADDK